jgi:hypothetical protein
MNDNQKILTAAMLPAFIFVGVLGFTPEGARSSLAGWVVVGVVYVALSFLLSRQPAKNANHTIDATASRT